MYLKRTLTTLVSMRKKRKMMQSVLCGLVNMSQREISFIENGRRRLSLGMIGAYLSALQKSEPISDIEWNNFIRAFISDTIYKWAEETPLDLCIDFTGSSITLGGETIPVNINFPNYPHLYKDEYLSVIAKVFNSNRETRELLLEILNSDKRKSLLKSIVSTSENNCKLVQNLLDAMGAPSERKHDNNTDSDRRC